MVLQIVVKKSIPYNCLKPNFYCNNLSLTQVLSVAAGITVQTFDNDAPVSAKVSKDCSAQSIRSPDHAVWSQFFVDLKKRRVIS